MYRSLYLYDDDVLEYISKNGTISQYDGLVYPDKIVLDYDGDNALENTANAIKKLTEIGVGTGYQTYFSGRGYHIEIDSRLFNFEPNINLPSIVKSVMLELFPSADNIFDKTRIYRAVNSINPKSGLYKIPLYKNEVLEWEHSMVTALARTARLDFNYSHETPRPIQGLKSGDKNKDNEPRKEIASQQIVNKYMCIQEILGSEPKEGERHNTLLRLASHFRRQGYDKNVTFNVLHGWVGRSYNANEIDKIIEDIYKWEHFYSCKDPILLKHCNHKCIFYTDVEVLDIADMQIEFEESLSETGTKLDLSTVFPSIVSPFIINGGSLVTILGSTGMGKSAFIQNITTFIKEKVIYFSLEMPGSQMYRRYLQIIANKDKEYVNNNYKELHNRYREDLSHILISTKAVFANEINKIIESHRPKIIVLDHILLMKSQYKDEYTKIGEITQTLKQIALNYGIIVFAISQVSREQSKGDSLNVYSGKGNGSIENDSDIVIPFQRASRTATKARIYASKDREGQYLDSVLDYNTTLRII
jgi:KaiC/GvpD/RAD55 family RecA-like ATPase